MSNLGVSKQNTTLIKEFILFRNIRSQIYHKFIFILLNYLIIRPLIDPFAHMETESRDPNTPYGTNCRLAKVSIRCKGVVSNF